MTMDQRSQYVSREAVLKLLSDAETAKVSNAEDAHGLKDGEEYIDLEHLDAGVQRAQPTTKTSAGNVLPRTAVSNETWAKILAQLKT